MDKTAPGQLETVQAFINTADLEEGTDLLGSAEGLRAWLTGRGLMAADTPASDCDDTALATAVAFREALRALCHSNNGAQPDGEALAALQAGSADPHLHLTARFGADGQISLEPDEDAGVRHALGVILTLVFGALRDGTWGRLKACAADDCQWAFYDHSKNRSGHWCNMAECGNRAKVRSYRARQGPAVAS